MKVVDAERDVVVRSQVLRLSKDKREIRGDEVMKTESSACGRQQSRQRRKHD
jgi:hypothetical protein